MYVRVSKICLKYFQILESFGAFELAATLFEKCPNTEFFLVRIFLYSYGILEITDQKKLHIWILSRSAILWCWWSKNFQNYRMAQQKQPYRGVLKKRCSEKCSKFTGEHSCWSAISIKLQWNHTSAWVVSCKYAAYFQKNFS